MKYAIADCKHAVDAEDFFTFLGYTLGCQKKKKYRWHN